MLETNTEKYLKQIRNLIAVVIVVYVVSFIIRWINEAEQIAMTYR